MTVVGIVGAGLAGLTAALRLSEAGYRVLVFERYPETGGLARAVNVGGEPLEAFYHHLFTTDTDYVRLAAELGLDTEIEWLQSRMGIYASGALWDFGTPMALLRFAPLGLADKVRFALSTLRLQHSHRPAPFEDVTAAEWLRRHQGERAWEVVWRPLLRQKFGRDAERVAMVWLWGKLYLRGRSRSASGLGERLGYLRGSFIRLVEALTSRLGSLGAEIRTSAPVRRVEPVADGLAVDVRGSLTRVDALLVTTPLTDYLEIAGHLLPEDELRRLRSVRFTGAICTLLEMDRSLTPYYWLNVADPDMPFGGLIEHTNFIPRERYGGRHVLYVSNYLFDDHPLFHAPRREVMAAYLPALRRINPRFSEDWITGLRHFRAASAQPVVTVGYRDLIPDMRTPVQGLYVCTMAQIYPEDRGQNYAIRYGERVARLLAADLAPLRRA